MVATDLPRLTAALLSWLADHPSRASVVPVALGVPQPLCARYPAGISTGRWSWLAMGRRAMRDLLEGTDALLVGPDEWQPAAGDLAALD